MSISKGTHISGVFTPNLDNTLIAYGDVKGTKDGIIILFSEDYKTIEILIARGMLNDIQCIFNEVCNGELNTEIEQLKQQAQNVFKGSK